jgi:hypothetical protein
MSSLPRHSVRAQAKRALRDGILATLGGADVYVSVGWPGERMDRRAVWVAGADGNQTLEFLDGSGRVHRDDDFTITVLCQVLVPGGDCAEAEEDVEQLAAAVEDFIASDPDVGIFGISLGSAMPVDGPDSLQIHEGAFAFVTYEIPFSVRYH